MTKNKPIYTSSDDFAFPALIQKNLPAYTVGSGEEKVVKAYMQFFQDIFNLMLSENNKICKMPIKSISLENLDWGKVGINRMTAKINYYKRWGGYNDLDEDTKLIVKDF